MPERPSRGTNETDLVRRYGKIGISAARYAPVAASRERAPQGDKMVQEPAETHSGQNSLISGHGQYDPDSFLEEDRDHAPEFVLAERRAVGAD